MTDYTTNFNLEKYQTGDAANLNDQYNASMDIIDTNLYKINTNANTAGGKAAQALETAQNNTKNLEALGVTDTATATQLKNTIETNKSDITDINNNLTGINNNLTGIHNNLTALHANNVTDANNLYNIITKQRLTNPYNSKIVCIGDSYGQGYMSSNEATKNPYAVMGRLLNATIYNYSDGGAGFIATSNNTQRTYNDQINYAATQVPNTNDIDFIMITGGQNDTTNVKSAVINTLQNAHQKFPNAKIIVYPCQWTAYQIWDTLLFRYAEICEGVTESGCATFVEYGYELNLGEWQWISSDNKHPNDTGYEVMGKKFASVMQGGYGGNTKSQRPLSYGANVTGSSRDIVTLDHGTLTVQMNLKIKTTLNASAPLALLPKFIVINDTTAMYKFCVSNKGEQPPKAIGYNNPDRNTDGKIYTPWGTEALDMFVSFTQHV
jgi:lysophospholipase L1-like esterase